MTIKEIKKEIPPNQELIDVLKEALIEAEKGELRCWVGVGIFNNKDITHMCCLDNKKKRDIYALLGNLFVLMTTLEKAHYLSDSNLEETEK